MPGILMRMLEPWRTQPEWTWLEQKGSEEMYIRV